MKKTLSILFSLLFLSSACWCKQWIIFHTYYLGYNHKFIAFEKENPETGKVDITNVYGSEQSKDIIYDMKYLTDGTRYTFFLAVTDEEWKKAISCLASWKEYTDNPTDKDCDSLMKQIADTLQLKRPGGNQYSVYGYVGELKETFMMRDEEGLMSLSKALVNSHYALAKLAGDSSRLLSAVLTTSFIWQTCFPDYSRFDNDKHLVLSTDGNKALKTELFVIHNYTSGGIKKAIVIFYTNDYTNGRKEDCHACYPVMSIARFINKNNKWRLDNFVQDLNASSGGWGKGPLLTYVVKNGKYYMKAHSADMHFGEISEWSDYYNLDSFKKEISE